MILAGEALILKALSAFLDVGKDIVFQTGEHLSPEGFHVVDALGGNGLFGGDEIIRQLQKLQNNSILGDGKNNCRSVGELCQELLEIMYLGLIVRAIVF